MDSTRRSETQAEAEGILRSWIQRQIGPVLRIVRQGRWRPAWYVDVSAEDGSIHKLYARGGRADAISQPQPLSFEFRVFQLFEASGVRVPHIHGYIEAIPAIIMDFARGQPNLSIAADEADREAVVSQFIDQMILMHRIDPRLMEAAGAPRPSGGNALALAYYRRIEPLYLKAKSRPEPAIEFIRGWLERNVPDHPDIAYPIAVDAGQFLFEGNRLTAMLDLEYCAIGDFHTDLAALRLRNRLEPIGDMQRMYRMYCERSGVLLDLHRIRYHTVIKGVLPPMQMAGVLARPSPEVDYYQYMIWNATWLRLAIESIAEIKDWAPEPFAPPIAGDTGRYDIVREVLTQDIDGMSADDEFSQYRRLKHHRMLRFLSRVERYQPDLERSYLRDIATLTGGNLSRPALADAALETFVRDASPSQDESILRVLWRQLLGQCFLLADPDDAKISEVLRSPLLPLREGSF